MQLHNDNNSNKSFLNALLRWAGVVGLVLSVTYYGYKLQQEMRPVIWITMFSLIGVIIIVLVSSFFRQKTIGQIRKGYEEELEKLRQVNQSLGDNGRGMPIRTRISILLPLHGQNEIVAKDIELILQGFGDALKKIGEDIDNYEIIFFDHEKKYQKAKDIVSSEIDRGTQYFIVTHSEVCVELSKEFPRMLEQKHKQAILLCTVAASPKIVCARDKVYRFFINAEEEVKFLVNHLKSEFKTATMIHFENHYSDIASSMFRELWIKGNDGHTCDEGTPIKKNQLGKIKDELRLEDNVSRLSNKDIIFVACYCTAYQEIFKTLRDLGVKSTIVTTSTFSFKEFSEPEEILRKHFDWITCYPQKKGKPFYGDVASYFAFASLYRLTAIINQPEYSIEKFDAIWRKLHVPDKLVFTLTEDPEVKLFISYHSKNDSLDATRGLQVSDSNPSPS